MTALYYFLQNYAMMNFVWQSFATHPKPQQFEKLGFLNTEVQT